MFYTKLQAELLYPLSRGLYVAFWFGRNPRHRIRVRLFRFIPGNPRHFIFEYRTYKPEKD